MQAPSVSTPITDPISTIFVAIELSQKTWLVTMHSPDRDKISRHKVQGGDHPDTLALDKVRLPWLDVPILVALPSLSSTVLQMKYIWNF